MSNQPWNCLAYYHDLLEKEKVEGESVLGTYQTLNDLQKGVLYRKSNKEYVLYASPKPVKEDLFTLLRKTEYETSGSGIPVLITSEIDPDLDRAAALVGIWVVKTRPHHQGPNVECAVSDAPCSECFATDHCQVKLVLCGHCLLPFMTFPGVQERLQSRLDVEEGSHGLLCPRCFSKSQLSKGFVFGGTIRSALQFLLEGDEFTKKDLEQILTPEYLPVFARALNHDRFPILLEPKVHEDQVQFNERELAEHLGPSCEISGPILQGETGSEFAPENLEDVDAPRDARTLDLELASFFLARSTGTLRMPTEPPLEYVMRAMIDLVSDPGPNPKLEKVEEATAATLLEAYLNSSKNVQAQLAKELDTECQRWAEECHIPRFAGESLFDFAGRVKGILDLHRSNPEARGPRLAPGIPAR
ncbi:MAG: hypothetical protein M1143_02895 [Candidatus Thermoplasmatota archaeon]|nr:hypothetical protein [Candidatus Thermoplasmatota archaeon]